MTAAHDGIGKGSYANGADEAADAVEALKGRLDQMRERASALIERTRDSASQLSESLTHARETAAGALDLIERRPLAAAGVAAVLGLAVGLLLAAGRPRIVLVERDD